MDRQAVWFLLFAALTPCALPARAASAEEGAAFMRRSGCAECHALEQLRPGLLTKLLKTRATPASLAGSIWNHGTTLLNRPTAIIQAADADRILAWFARAGYFETPGDARQGLRTFKLQNCATCHQEKDRTSAPPVSHWPSLQSPASLFLAMWRHAPLMRSSLDENRMMWPSLSAVEIRDLLAYARQANASPTVTTPDFVLGNPDAGQKLLTNKACLTCHRGRQTMESRPADQSFTTLAGILWNHAPMMMSLPPSLTPVEMGDLLAYLWQSRYFDEPGDASQGRTAFEVRRCAACHDGFTSSTSFDASAMLAAFFKHQGPVLEKARSLGIGWPRFTGREMANVIAYANSVRRRPLVK